MSSEATTAFARGLQLGAFILGKPAVAKQISKHIAVLDFLTILPNHNLLSPRSGLHLVIAACDFEDSAQVAITARALQRLTNPEAHKIIYCLGPAGPRLDQLLLAPVLHGHFTAFGPDRDARLRQYLKHCALTQKHQSSYHLVEKQLSEALANMHTERLRQLYHKLCRMDKKHYLTLRLKAQACRSLGLFTRSIFYLKQMLHQNPQDLWASNTLAAIHATNTGSAKQGLELIKQLSDYGAAPTLTGGGEKNCLDLLQGLPFPANVLGYLQHQAKLHSVAEKDTQAIHYYQLVLRGSVGDPVSQARTLYQMGLSYLKANDRLAAKECFHKSVSQGGSQFTKAAKALETLNSIPNSERATATLARTHSSCGSVSSTQARNSSTKQPSKIAREKEANPNTVTKTMNLLAKNRAPNSHSSQESDKGTQKNQEENLYIELEICNE